VHVLLIFPSEWCKFASASCRKNYMGSRVKNFLISRASFYTLSFRFCNKIRLAIRHMNGSLFQTTLSIPSYDMGRSSDWGLINNTSYVLYVSVCVCMCVCSRARIHFVVLKSNPRRNENFCTRPTQTTSRSDGDE
jgi:hypothetical protein